MNQEETIPKTEERLGYAMVKAHLLSDNQLKTAFDYQRSLGGSIVDVVTKLGFVRAPALAKFVAEFGNSPDSTPATPTGPAPTAVEAAAARAEAAAATSSDTPPPAPPAAPASPAPGIGLRKEIHRPPQEPREVPASAPEPEASTKTREAAPISTDPVLEALIGLLIKKGVFRRRELEDLLK